MIYYNVPYFLSPVTHSQRPSDPSHDSQKYSCIPSHVNTIFAPIILEKIPQRFNNDSSNPSSSPALPPTLRKDSFHEYKCKKSKSQVLQHLTGLISHSSSPDEVTQLPAPAPKTPWGLYDLFPVLLLFRPAHFILYSLLSQQASLHVTKTITYCIQIWILSL